MKTLLHVGCGTKTLSHLPAYFQSGWDEVRLDIDPAVKPDIVASLTDLRGLDENAYDAVWSSHNIEHLHHHEARQLVVQLRRVLGPSGWVVITCPDIRSAMQHALKSGLDSPVYHSGMGPITPRDILFGHQRSIEQGNEFMAHKNGFDLTALAGIFKGSGFKRVFGRRKGVNLWFIAGRFEDAEAAKDQLNKVLGG